MLRPATPIIRRTAVEREENHSAGNIPDKSQHDLGDRKNPLTGAGETCLCEPAADAGVGGVGSGTGS